MTISEGVLFFHRFCLMRKLENGKSVVKENGNVVLSRGDYMGEYTMRKITFCSVF